MNTQIILIIIGDIAIFIIGVILGTFIKRKNELNDSGTETVKTETAKTETVKNISLSKITSFITEKLSEDEEIEIIKAAEKNPRIAMMITRMTKHLHDMHRKIKSGFK